MKIKVKAKHIRQGTRRHGKSCPIAQAIHGALRKRLKFGHQQVYVSSFDASINHVLYCLPVEAQLFIRRFDDGLAVEPFKFNLREW